jgi:putative membrane protein
MKKNLVNLLFLAFAVFFASCEGKKNDDSKELAKDQNEENLEDSDEKKDADFAVNAADGGLYEVQLATLALTKATSSRVKQFAQMMVDDHSKANAELKSLASQKNIVLPDVMSEKCQKKYYDLDQKKQGNEFDREYIDQMVKDHKEDIDVFEKEADKGNDGEVKSWASGKIATLRHHLEEAERIKEDLKSKK